MEEQLMPKKYEAIRDKFLKEGLTTKLAKQRAAKIFNATRKPGTRPVTRKEGK
jgi:hypothetical protein